MRYELNDFGSGWTGPDLGLSYQEIEELIQCLKKLQQGEVDHLHFRNDFQGSGGLADVEIYIDSEPANHALKLECTGVAYPKGDSKDS